MIGSYTLLHDQNKFRVKKKNYTTPPPPFVQGALYVNKLVIHLIHTPLCTGSDSPS